MGKGQGLEPGGGWRCMAGAPWDPAADRHGGPCNRVALSSFSEREDLTSPTLAEYQTGLPGATAGQRRRSIDGAGWGVAAAY